MQMLFESSNPVHLMLEDFLKPNGSALAGDVYFDNIKLENPHPAGQAAQAPEPATMLLLASGLAGLGFGKFRKRNERR